MQIVTGADTRRCQEVKKAKWGLWLISARGLLLGHPPSIGRAFPDHTQLEPCPLEILTSRQVCTSPFRLSCKSLYVVAWPGPVSTRTILETTQIIGGLPRCRGTYFSESDSESGKRQHAVDGSWSTGLRTINDWCSRCHKCPSTFGFGMLPLLRASRSHRT